MDDGESIRDFEVNPAINKTLWRKPRENSSKSFLKFGKILGSFLGQHTRPSKFYWADLGGRTCPILFPTLLNNLYERRIAKQGG